jgi:hypothetical protein
MKFIVIIFLLQPLYMQSQVSGCTDRKAQNYNPSATQNDGSCSYKKTTVERKQSIDVSNKIRETSGLIHWNNKLWTHNDDTDTNLYALDTVNGNIVETYALPNTVNTDWEEMAQDEDYIYIGDFGNNAQGNRTNLTILKIEKNSIITHNPAIEYIHFKYPNQTNFEKQKANTTNFDCEAFLITKDSICLFTKEWTSKKTTLYTLPKVPGDYIAQQKETFDVKGLITGVNYIPEKKRLVFCGYTKNGTPFIYLFYDFKDYHFFSGNKRRINLKPRFQQIEGISSLDGVRYYLTNEHLKFLTIDNLQKMQMFDLSNFFRN